MTVDNKRYHAQRSYVIYIYGLLGKFDHKVVPACLLERIGEFYRSDNGSYVGYLHVNPDTGEGVPRNDLEEFRRCTSPIYYFVLNWI